MKKMKNKNESGQALTELVVSLMGFLIIFSGFLMLSTLSTEGVANLIRARTNADNNSQGGITTGSTPKSIRSWDYGEVPFTYDDKPVTYSQSAGGVFTNELSDNTGTFTLGALSGNANYIHNNFSQSLPDANLFVEAANLTEGRSNVDDPFEKRKIKEIKHLVDVLFGARNYSMRDSLYMPLNTYLEHNAL